MPKKQQKQRGPKTEHLKIEGDWERAVKKALRKQKPPEGWPKESK
ncbi:MAG: hypothetical protein WBL85_08980 [Sedimentisphaerales bacterium]